MNYKILITGLIIIAFIIGIIFLNLKIQQEDSKNNITISFPNISSNVSPNSTYSLPKNQDIPKNFSHKPEENTSIRYENISPEYKNFTGFLTNKRYKYTSRIYFYHTTSGDYTKEFNVTTYIKGIKTSDENEYTIIESKVNLPKKDIVFHPTNNIPNRISFKCPPECEKINFLTWYWDTVEYVDLNNQNVQIIGIPWVTHYKMENKTVYQRLEIAPDKNITYEYNLSNPDISNGSLLREMLYNIFEFHPLYLPGFVNYTLQFNTTQNLENKVVKDNPSTGTGFLHFTLEKLSLDSEKFEGKDCYKIVYLFNQDENNPHSNMEKFTIRIDKKDETILYAKFDMCKRNIENGMFNNFTYRDYRLVNEYFSYCGDKVCDPANKEDSETCCKDCGCRDEKEECRDEICVLKVKDGYMLINKIFNYSFVLPGEYYGKKADETKILFYSNNETKKYCTLNIQIVPSRDVGGAYNSAEDIKEHLIEQIGNYENLTEKKLKIGASQNVDAYEITLYEKDNGIKRTDMIAKHNNYFYIITYISTTEYYANAYEDYKKIVQSFVFL